MKPLPILLLAAALLGASTAAARVPARPARTQPPAPKPPTAAPAAVPREAEEFFETEVRPVLVEQCATCHGPKLQQSGLRVDSLAALLKGGRRGPALVKGNPEASLLIRSLHHDGPLKMPPTGKLPDRQVEALARWVAHGAPWAVQSPKSRVLSPAGAGAGSSSEHWAFRPVTRPAVPQIRNPSLRAARGGPQSAIRNPIDAFVLAKLQAKGLAPAPPADRRTLIRRAHFDLTGLPPTVEEIEAFVNDRSPDAWEKVIDRLLASPRYGERWGRYWLDMARYADTKGYVYTGERRYPFSYTYRDYVIRAFNEDLPYDRFLKEQIAADLLPQDEDRRSLAALGFLTLGRRFVNMQPDIIDDRIDVVFRSTQALTVSCARCHDHKYDPIPTADYYSLYGVFAGSTEKTVPIGGPPQRSEAFAAYETELRKRQEAFDTALERRCAELSDRIRNRIEDYLVTVPQAEKLPGEEFYVIMGADDVNPILVRNWRAYVDTFRGSMHPVFGPWHALERLKEGEFAARAPALAREFAANVGGKLSPRVAALFAGEAPQSMEEVARRYGKLLAEVDGKWRAAVKAAAESGASVPSALPDAREEALRQVLYAPDSPASIPKLRISEVEYYFDEKTRNELNELQAKIDQWQIQSAATPPHALALEDLPIQREPRVFLRGNPSTKGEVVPRRFLAVFSGPERKPWVRGSGRLELAEAIASRDNPLTARVMVNRVWLGHFGRGLVDTPSDFGLRSEPPSHPELLDWLAARFTRSAGVPSPESRVPGRTGAGTGVGSEDGLGWSVKTLHRLIMFSATYQQASEPHLPPSHSPPHPEGEGVGGKGFPNPQSAIPNPQSADPENRLLWRQNRRRLDWEALRDSLLHVSGQLDLTAGGPPVDIFRRPFSRRRSVHALIDRQNLPGLLRVFDFANPDRHSPQRHETTSPQQALFMLNSPFVTEQAAHLLRRPEIEAAVGPERVRRLYGLVYGRAPTPEELAAAVEFLGTTQAASPAAPSPWEYGWAAVPEDAARVEAFQPFAQFTGEAWQGGEAWPDPATGWARLTAAGGHAGNDAGHAVVRRWTAPHDGSVSVSGKLSHGTKEGDGVRARLFSSRLGLLGTWNAHNGSAETRRERVEVRKGDTLDFVVDCRGSISHDDFLWAPVVRSVPSAPGESAQWDAAADFNGPALSAWEQYVQALLLANEFVFVD